jgi:hypothetical protein
MTLDGDPCNKGKEVTSESQSRKPMTLDGESRNIGKEVNPKSQSQKALDGNPRNNEREENLECQGVYLRTENRHLV